MLYLKINDGSVIDCDNLNNNSVLFAPNYRITIFMRYLQSMTLKDPAGGVKISWSGHSPSSIRL